MNHDSPIMETMSTMKDTLQDALDELVSWRTSSSRIGEVLSMLERLLAEMCTQTNEEALTRLYVFITLQDSFECNVPSRVLSWMSTISARLEHITSKTSSDHEQKAEAITLSGQLMQALSILQGVALNHKASKKYLGRRYALEILLDLLLTSRHVSPIPLTNVASPPTSPKQGEGTSSSQTSDAPSVSLASTILDTLLCILVDSSPALRIFEDLGGVQLVVKILKRGGTPREARSVGLYRCS